MISGDELALDARAPRSSLVRAAAVVYAGSLAQGLTVVSFPASGALFKARGFTDAEYGALFLPQVGFTLLASLAGARLAARVGLACLLGFASAASVVAALVLYASSVVEPTRAFPVLLAGTAAMGTGFGLAAAPLNTLPPRLFPARGDAALLALHTLMGAGFALGPWLAGSFIHAGIWARLPLGLALLNVALCAVARRALADFDARAPRAQAAARLPLRDFALWAFIAAAVLYAFAEGTFSNWAILYLHEERALAEATAGVALSSFWGALVVGRLVSATLVTRFDPGRLWLVLAAAMVAAFQLLPFVRGDLAAIAGFAFAGASASAVFPLTVTLASRRFPEHAAQVSAAMIASLMFGVGLASFSIGPLRAVLSLAQIYRASALYPAGMLGLGGALFWRRR